jgi:dipeptidyl aminopeptidase/acylaminoacyl peptidase
VPASVPCPWRAALGALLVGAAAPAAAQRQPLPLRQATAADSAAGPLTIEQASRSDRWLGLGVRDVRWSPDGAVVYFRWHRAPRPDDLPEEDAWFRADARGRWAEAVPAAEAGFVPGDDVAWNPAGDRAAWVRGPSLYAYRAGAVPAVRRLVTLTAPLRDLRFGADGASLFFSAAETLYRYDPSGGALQPVAARVTVTPPQPTEAARLLAAEQRELLPSIREADRVRARRGALERARPGRPQPLPVPAGATVDRIQLSPDGRFVTFRATTPDPRRPPTRYIDFVDESGYSRVLEARPKVGEPRDRVRLGIVAVDPAVPAESLAVRWVDLPEAGDQQTVPHGPSWSPDGARAVVQFAGEHGKDLWIAELDVARGTTRVLVHEHDPAWLGGPPIQANYRGPTLLEWLPGGRLVFASERSGWSHLHLLEPDGRVRALTEGPWEVRDARLARDRATWLLQTSRAHPADDQLELMPAAGGPLRPVTAAPGRHTGVLSPDGTRLARVHSTTSALHDLFVAEAGGGAPVRVTASGAPGVLGRLVTPEIVSFPHPDGQPVWAAFYRPRAMNPERAAVIHFHGGGYRQFAHRGWSVYGWGLHVGFLHHLLEQGYPVLDFDYRAGAGFGRAYRTDVAGAMGGKDVDGAVAAARWLVRTQGVDSARIGVYGVSYGGFMTLMSQFRYPGVFAAGISRAPVTDWAHYSDEWTSRILGLPQRDTAAYRRSSPIHHAEGLRDALLIEHGIMDDNVHFQDAARLVQRLIELGKDFDVMYYPTEPHTVQTEAARLDQSKRAIRFFDRHLRRRSAP